MRGEKVRNIGMEEKNYTEVLINGNVYTLGGAEDPEYLQKVAAYINEKVAVLKAQPGFTRHWFGVLMALYGACYAIMENDMRRLLSYHIVSQVGFMVAGVGLGTAMALNGATAHAFSHILYKSLLFMCAGAIIYATGIRKINQLGGLAKKMPFTFWCFVIAALSISGVPLFNGFISKSITISAAAAAHYGSVELLLQLAGVGTFLSIALKMIYFIFLAPDNGVVIKREVPKNMYVAMGIGATLCVLYGVYPELLYRYLPFTMEPYHPFTVDHITQSIEMLGMAMLPFSMAYVTKS